MPEGIKFPLSGTSVSQEAASSSEEHEPRAKASLVQSPKPDQTCSCQPTFFVLFCSLYIVLVGSLELTM